MADITLKGNLNLMGNLTFDGGKLLIGDAGLEALVQVTAAEGAQGVAPPVMLPPPGPTFPQPDVWIINSFNQTVMAKTKAVVALGMVMQGVAASPWPGMMLPSSGNASVTINGVFINVKSADQAVIFPSGGSASFTVASGQ